MIDHECPNCGKHCRLPDAFSGRTVRCRTCRKTSEVLYLAIPIAGEHEVEKPVKKRPLWLRLTIAVILIVVVVGAAIWLHSPVLLTLLSVPGGWLAESFVKEFINDVIIKPFKE